jgi:hypothetical protein
MNYYLDTEFIEGQQSLRLSEYPQNPFPPDSDIDRNSVPRWQRILRSFQTLILKKRGIEIKKEITELRITRMAKSFR